VISIADRLAKEPTFKQYQLAGIDLTLTSSTTAVLYLVFDVMMGCLGLRCLQWAMLALQYPLKQFGAGLRPITPQ
jgi:hypothetical protein